MWINGALRILVQFPPEAKVGGSNPLGRTILIMVTNSVTLVFTDFKKIPTSIFLVNTTHFFLWDKTGTPFKKLLMRALSCVYISSFKKMNCFV